MASLKKKNVPDLLILLILSLITCRELFLSDMKFVSGTDILGWHFRMEPYLWGRFRGWIYMWDPFRGCGVPITPPTPLFLLTGFLTLAAAFFNTVFTSLVAKLVVFLIFPIAGFSMYLLTYHTTRNRAGAFISGVFYMYNQWFLTEHVSEGHVFIPFGYAIAPLIFLSLEFVLKNPRRKWVLTLSLLLVPLLGTASHPVYIVGASSVLYLILWILSSDPDKGKGIIGVLKGLSLATIACVLLSAYWIIPEFFIKRMSEALFGVYKVIDDAYLFSYKSMPEALAIRNTHENLSGQRIPYWEFPPLQQMYANGLMLIIPILAFSSLLIRRDRLTIFYSLSAAITSFLALGPHGMPIEIFIWLWYNVPGYSTFRSGGRFLMMTALSYAYLIGLSTGWICDKLTNLGAKLHLDKIFLVLIVLFILGYSWVGSVGGVQVYDWPEEYTEAFEWIREQPGDFRIVTIPYGRTWATYPWSNRTVDVGLAIITDMGGASSSLHKKGVFWSETDYANFIGSMIKNNLSNKLSTLLGIANIRYVVIEPDASQYDRNLFTQQENLLDTPFIGNATILENAVCSPHIFSVKNSSLIFGGLSIIPSLDNIDGFELNKWALFFSDQTPSPSPVEEYDDVVLSEADALDLLFMIYGESYFLRAAEYASPAQTPPSTG